MVRYQALFKKSAFGLLTVTGHRLLGPSPSVSNLQLTIRDLNLLICNLLILHDWLKTLGKKENSTNRHSSTKEEKNRKTGSWEERHVKRFRHHV